MLATAGTVNRAEIPTEIQKLAEALGRIHGGTTLTMEAKGWHIYVACPHCLEQEGDRELGKRHLSLNADRFYGRGRFAQVKGTYDADWSGLCMKEDKAYSVSTLLNMKPVQERGYTPQGDCGVRVQTKERFLIDDGRGNMIPEHPGLTRSILDLPDDHVAVQYLKGRGYDLQSLWNQFQCSWCYQETPERREPVKRFYRKLPGGFKDTPQGRIIFFAYVKGVQVAWQGRIPDKVEGGIHYYWSPYEDRWAPVEVQVGVKDGKPVWALLPPFNTKPPYTWDNPEWEISKYKTARDAARNEMLLGLDAALEWNRLHGREHNALGIGTEGPLDAGKLGSPAVALCGKFLSENQAKLIVANFKEFCYLGDSDEAGKKAAVKVKAELGMRMKLHMITLPAHVKDVGELSILEAKILVAPYTKTLDF